VLKIFLVAAVSGVLLIPSAFAADHHSLNGTWTLASAEGAGSEVIRNARITVNDRQHNIYISRNFTYDGAGETISTNFTTDGREHATIKEGHTFKSKAKWDGDVLKVTTVGDEGTEIERYNPGPDGTMTLLVERPGHSPLTLHFRLEE
jgi:hypothetical protein